MNYCSECGEKLEPKANFCHVCGHQLVQLVPAKESSTVSAANHSSKPPDSPKKASALDQEKLTEPVKDSLIMETLIGKEFSYYTVLTVPDIPEKKLVNAAQVIAQGIDPSEIVALIDTTLFGSAKTGFVFAKDAIYIKESVIDETKLPYDGITDLELLYIRFHKSDGKTKKKLRLTIYYGIEESSIFTDLQDIMNVLNVIAAILSRGQILKPKNKDVTQDVKEISAYDNTFDRPYDDDYGLIEELTWLTVTGLSQSAFRSATNAYGKRKARSEEDDPESREKNALMELLCCYIFTAEELAYIVDHKLEYVGYIQTVADKEHYARKDELYDIVYQTHFDQLKALSTEEITSTIWEYENFEAVCAAFQTGKISEEQAKNNRLILLEAQRRNIQINRYFLDKNSPANQMLRRKGLKGLRERREKRKKK